MTRLTSANVLRLLELVQSQPVIALVLGCLSKADLHTHLLAFHSLQHLLPLTLLLSGIPIQRIVVHGHVRG